MAIKIPNRYRQVEASGQKLWLRTPNRAELGPVIDAQLAAEEDQSSTNREILERGSQEQIAVACVRVCVRSTSKGSDKPEVEYDDALALALDAAATEGVPLTECELVRTSMALCRATPPKLDPTVLTVRRTTTPRTPGSSAGLDCGPG